MISSFHRSRISHLSELMFSAQANRNQAVQSTMNSSLVIFRFQMVQRFLLVPDQILGII